jgi:hypothetical protein
MTNHTTGDVIYTTLDDIRNLLSKLDIFRLKYDFLNLNSSMGYDFRKVDMISVDGGFPYYSLLLIDEVMETPEYF